MLASFPESFDACSRRTFLRAAAAGFAALALERRTRAASQDKPARIVLGSGAHTYEWLPAWAKLPGGMTFGNTHGCIVVDQLNRVFMNTDTEHAVIIFDAAGNFIKSWGKDFKGGAHGMCLVKEGNAELLYLAHIGRGEVVKTTLDGDVLMTLGVPEKAGVYKDRSEYHPTSVAVGPSGDIYVADGYGLSWIHQYDAKGEYIRSWGGAGSEPGKMQTPHGIWLDTRREPAVLVVADRENHRLQTFSLDGKPLGMVTGVLRRPCHLHQRGTDLVVADLEGRVTILDRDNKVITHLGDNPDPKKRAQNGVPSEQWKDGEFISPHCARWDQDGNLYVLDWVAQGRITKLKHVS
ncbi:MAG: hypothetical protein U1E76_00430 [Planctomycetota bacterium]